MNHLSSVELDSKLDQWDILSDFIYRLDKGPYYLEEI